MTTLQGLGAIVLGAGGKDNIGQAIARRLAREGARVLVAGRQEAPLRALAEEIGGVFQLADATSEGDLAALVERAHGAFGGLRIAVNSTGRNLQRPLLETTRADLEEISEIQFVAPYLFLQAAVRGMPEGGAITHISSVTAQLLLRNHAAYMGTKAGMEQVVRAFAFEFGERGVRVNCVSPGLTQTPMTAMAFANPDFTAFCAANTPMRRLGTPDDIAAAVAWLSTPECFVTGETLQANGGAQLVGPPPWVPR